MDATSLWHIAALQVAGMESMTIPSRLRVSLGGRGTLQDIEDTINSTGKRRIAQFGMSIADPEVLSDKVQQATSHTEKSGSVTSRRASEDEDSLSRFDMDVFTREYRTATRTKETEHVFGRAEGLRGDWDLAGHDGRDPHDRFDRGPSIQRYVIAL